MRFDLSSFRISVYHSLALSGVFLVAGVIVVMIMNAAMKREALEHAREKARIILDRNLATHTYFSHDLKPKVFALTDPYREKDYFEPAWMSSTYAVRDIDQHYRDLGNGEYYYKECAINARDPRNEADVYERSFIEQLNSDPELTERAEVRTVQGQPFFVVLRRGEVLEDACLRCHSRPENAPGDLVRAYGADRSFDRKVGEVVSAISIRVPLAVAYEQADGLTVMLSGMLIAVLVALFLTLMWLNRQLVFEPMERLRDKALKIALDERSLGETVNVPAGRELADLATAFNAMSTSLGRSRDHLEETVKRRTADLRQALENVKKLSGLLPICSHCKKVRDDEGYWKQIEVFVRDHSDAQFSHGICPECARKNYPKYFKEGE